jgi:hypothetical protein
VKKESQLAHSRLAQWALLLTSPFAWAAMLGLLFSLTDEVCARRSTSPMLVAGSICLLLAALPLPLAYGLRRRLMTGADEQARFMLGLACGSSAIFVFVIILSLLPVLWLDACRT